jgi:hypothetical protein
MSTSSRNSFSSPPLADNVPHLPPINNTIVGSDMPQADSPNSASGGNAHVDNAKLTVDDPPDHLHAGHILIAFLAAAVETKQQDDDNRSIGRNYCIRTTADGPYMAAGIFACNHIVVVNTSCT